MHIFLWLKEGDFMFMTVKEVARLLRISERHTYKLIKKMLFLTQKLGGKFLSTKKNY